MNEYRPDRHELVDVEVMPSTTRKGSIVGWFVRVTYTGDPVRDFRGTRSEVNIYETKAEADKAAAAVREETS